MSARPSPVGLRTMMALVRQSSHTSNAADAIAGRVHPIAQRVVNTLHAGDGEIDHEFALAVEQLFPGLEGEPTTITAAQAGFYLGIATAWLMLAQLQGAERMR